MSQNKINSVLRLEESSKTIVPEHFKRLIGSILTDRENLLKVDKSVLEIFDLKNDYALCVFVTVALECGFRLDQSPSKNFDIQLSREVMFSPKWRDIRKRIYTVDLFLSDLKNHKFVLLIEPILGNAVLVNLLAFSNHVIVSSAVDTLFPSQWFHPFQSTIPERFINLPSLARHVRRFFQKEKDLALNADGICNPSLLGLPDELKRTILKLLNLKDFLTLTTTCKLLLSYKNDMGLWKHFLKRDFGTESVEPFVAYVSKYRSRKHQRPVFQDFMHHMYT